MRRATRETHQGQSSRRVFPASIDDSLWLLVGALNEVQGKGLKEEPSDSEMKALRE